MTAAVGAWDGTFSRAQSGVGSGATAAGTPTPTRQAPRRSFGWPGADDPESGLLAYYWRVDTVPAAGFTDPGWTASGSQPAITLTGDPLDYERQLYFSLVAVNYAGLATEPLSVGPFRVPDPTRPSSPTFCAGLGGSTDRLSISVVAPAGDPETRVLGYEYRVRTATATVRDWTPGTADWTTLSSGAAVTTSPVALTDGQSYSLDVRAVNGHGLYGDTVTSGPVYFDASPPPMPTAAAQVGAGQLTVLPLTISGAADPQSGFMTQHLAVGTSQRAADVVAWRNVPGAVAGEYTVEIPLGVALTPGATYWLQIRTVNLAGLASAIYSTSFTVPAARTTLPRTGR
jgi:hypothetical protein